jgi:hypothetical protein
MVVREWLVCLSSSGDSSTTGLTGVAGLLGEGMPLQSTTGALECACVPASTWGSSCCGSALALLGAECACTATWRLCGGASTLLGVECACADAWRSCGGASTSVNSAIAKADQLPRDGLPCFHAICPVMVVLLTDIETR